MVSSLVSLCCELLVLLNNRWGESGGVSVSGILSDRQQDTEYSKRDQTPTFQQLVTNHSLLFSATNLRYVLMCNFSYDLYHVFYRVSLLCTLGTLSEYLNNKPLVIPQSLWCLWSWLCLHQRDNYQLINCCGLIAQCAPCVNIWALCCSQRRRTGAGLVPCVINVCQARTTEALVRLWAAGIKGAFSHAWPSRSTSSLCLWSGAKSTRLLL